MITVHLNATVKAGDTAPAATIRVWDGFVRVFHWSLVTLFATAYVNGEQMQQVHIAIASLLVLRIIWGFVGSRHARFSDFARLPRQTIAYLRDAMSFRAHRYIGHNSAGGLMVIALIIVRIGTRVTGYIMTTGCLLGFGSHGRDSQRTCQCDDRADSTPRVWCASRQL